MKKSRNFKAMQAKLYLLKHLLITLLLVTFSTISMSQEISSSNVDISYLLPEIESSRVSSATQLDYRTESTTLAIKLAPSNQITSSSDSKAYRPGIPLQIGISRNVPDQFRGNLLDEVSWKSLPSGSLVTSISLVSPGADQLRIALLAKLPPNALIRFFDYEHDVRSSYPIYTIQNFSIQDKNRGYMPNEDPIRFTWSPILNGDTVGLEIELLENTKIDGLYLKIERLSHIAAPVSKVQINTASDSQETEDCEVINVACKNLAECPSSAVGRLNYTKDDGGTYQCTGTVINTHRSQTANVLDPYMLTAYHCISDQETADTVEVDFFYEFSNCQGNSVSNQHRTVRSGAELLVADATTDTSLIELRSRLPNGVCRVGWSASNAGLQTKDDDVHSISHPNSEPKKYASGNPVRYGVVKIEDNFVDALTVDWDEGATMSGSSGGGLWTHIDQERTALIGTLSGSPATSSCGVTGVKFGRFDVFFFNEGQRYLNTDNPSSDDHSGYHATATKINLNSTKNGEIDHRADSDVFRLDVDESGMLVLFTVGDIDLFARIYDQNGELIAANDQGGHMSNVRIAVSLEVGTYYIRISGYNPKAVGKYALHNKFTAMDDVPTAEVPLFVATSNDLMEGLIRILNTTREAGYVEITAFDDEGTRYGPVSLEIDSIETKSITASDLEKGNQMKGLSGQLGEGVGNWRLRLDTQLDLEVAAFTQTSDGFITSMHDSIYVYREYGQYFVPIFNSASEETNFSRLRISNPDLNRDVRISIWGQDDAGYMSSGIVELTIPAGASRSLDAHDLELGNEDLTGTLGDGEGKWRLWLEAEGDIVVLNLLENDFGYFTNLSSPGQIIE